MIRPLPLLGAALAAGLLLAGISWVLRRTPGTAPQEEAYIPFKAQPLGAGTLTELQPPPSPLRALRWTNPLPGGAAVAQILSQTGRQQVVLIQEGNPGPHLLLACPQGVPASFFQFAELADAAVVPGETLALLYRGLRQEESGLVMVWDLRGNRLQTWCRTQGERLALAADRRSLFLFGGAAPIGHLDLGTHRGPGPATPSQVDLPAEVKEVTGFLPLGGASFALTHPGGLALWRDGAWTHPAVPPASALGFNKGCGTVAGARGAAWWQPEPGLLLPLGADGTPGTPVDLKALLPEAAALDAPLLRLLGVDPDGQLWFDLAKPNLPPPIHLPAGAVQAPTESEPVAAAPPPLVPAEFVTFTREAMEAHLALGLDRLYRWQPKTKAMARVLWSEVWNRLGAPTDLPRPTGGADLRPEAGGLHLGAPERRWWLPLRALQVK
jgi:hypothetical protein